MKNRKRCTLGLWDESIPGIYFDPEGVSNYARIQLSLMKDFPVGEEAGLKDWNSIIDSIKRRGHGKPYDCLIGVSGGTDSSYLLHLAKEYGLRPLAVNLDNGWNSDIAVKNIKKVTSALGIDLETYVIEYEEIKDLLATYIRAGLPWIDAPTDMAIQSVLYKIAQREKLKFILIGNDFRSEGKQPTEWTYSDQRMLSYVHKKFGKVRLKTYPRLNFLQLLYLGYVRKVKLESPFNYIDYNKQSAQQLLIEKYGWEYYGEHHHENLFTKWAIGYWMYEKFGIDKRIITYSAQVLNKKMERKTVLDIIGKLPYDPENIQKETDYVLKKLDISHAEFENIWKAQNKSIYDYPSYYVYLYKFARLISPIVKYIVPVKPKIFYEIDERKKSFDANKNTSL